MATYRIGVRGCQHLGYAAGGMRTNKTTGWNQRVVDGHIAHQLTMESMLAAGVRGIVDGGDIMHFNKPLPRDVAVANRVDDMRAAAGIWGISNTGNHDAGGGSDIAAAGVIHRPHLGMTAVYPDPSRSEGVGPYPGLYEVHTAASNPHLPAGLALHIVSHYGLSKLLDGNGITIDPQPLPGMVNLLFAHGTFETDERLLRCIKPHGEERPIPPEWAERGFDALLLSHYHTAGVVPGYNNRERGQVWYTGSALRRGFSDEPGGRGWLQVDVHDTGEVTIELVPIWQRPQLDLPVIDADGLTVEQLDQIVSDHLASATLTDTETGVLTGDPGVIVRQKILGSSAAQRIGLGRLRGRYTNMAADAAHWVGVVFDHNRNETATPPTGDTTTGDETDRGWALGARVADYSEDLRGRYPTIAHRLGVPDPLHHPVLDQAVTWVGQIQRDATAADHDTTT